MLTFIRRFDDIGRIEDLLEYARFDSGMFPNVLLSVFNNGKPVKWHHCPFFIQAESDDTSTNTSTGGEKKNGYDKLG